MLVDGIPETELGGDAVAEPMQKRHAIAAFRRGGQPENSAGSHRVSSRSYDAAAAW